MNLIKYFVIPYVLFRKNHLRTDDCIIDSFAQADSPFLQPRPATTIVFSHTSDELTRLIPIIHYDTCSIMSSIHLFTSSLVNDPLHVV